MQQKIGSGVIIDPEGYIVTNAHVIGGAQHVRVSVPVVATNEATDEPIISRSRMVDARVVGADEEIDLAVLKIEATKLPALRLGDYNKLRQGDFVSRLVVRRVCKTQSRWVWSARLRDNLIQTVRWSMSKVMQPPIPATAVVHS